MPPGIVEVLQLDGIQYEGLTITHTQKGVTIEGEPRRFVLLENDCHDRGLPGWDQPAWYYRSAKAAARKIHAARMEAAHADTK